MEKISNYNNFLIQEKYDKHIKRELKKLGVTDKRELRAHLYHAHRGNLAKYLKAKGKEFTFGMLLALFKDAQRAKKLSGLKVGAYKMVHRIVPMALAPFFPILAIVGYILGSTRAINKIINPVLKDPGNSYPNFLGRLIDSSMRIAEGEIPTKDRFTRAFVVSDNIVGAIKEDVLQKFSLYLSEKMSKEPLDKSVPSRYVENELKRYLNKEFNINPEIPTRK